jgi:hypothetical protein
MLPGLRLILAAISATILLVVLGFMQLVKLHVAQDHSSNYAPVEARFAGLAFAPRADWTPIPSFRSRSLESLPPFDNIPPLNLPPDEDAWDAEVPAQIVVLFRAYPERPQPAAERTPRSMSDAAPAFASQALKPAPIDGAPHEAMTPGSSPAIAADRLANAVRERADQAVIKLAALSPTRAGLANAATLRILQLNEAPVARAPEPIAAGLISSTVSAGPARTTAAVLEAPSAITPMPVEVAKVEAPRAAEPAAPLAATLPASTPATVLAVVTRDVTPMPTPRPSRTIAALPRKPVPLPARRPATAANVERKTQLRPEKKVARAPQRKPAAPREVAQPPAPPATTNPFAALFGN